MLIAIADMNCMSQMCECKPIMYSATFDCKIKNVFKKIKR